MDQSYKEWLCANDMTIKEKDSLIKQLEGSVDEYKVRLICMDSILQSMKQKLKRKDDACISLKENLADAESEKNNFELRNQDRSLETAKLCKDNKDLNDLLSSFVAKVTELDKEHASVSTHVFRLLSSFERFQGMVEEEKMLITDYNCTSPVCCFSEEFFASSMKRRDPYGRKEHQLQLISHEAKRKDVNLCWKSELQKTQEIVMLQNVEECQVVEDNIIRLESEAELSVSNFNWLEKLSYELQVRIQKLLEDCTHGPNHQAEKHIREIENKCNEKISENKKDSESYLMHLKEEHGTMVPRIQQDNEHKESTLRDYRKEELQLIQSQADNELRERLSLLRKEHELQIKSLPMRHEEECQRLQEELELQKSKEEKQTALLQLQWKVMGENQQIDQEVNSKKEYSVSSMKRRDPYGRKEHGLQLISPEAKRKDVELMSENSGVNIEIEEQKTRVIELQKTQEIVMVQHVEECQVAKDKIRRLESEAELSASNINWLEKLSYELQVRIQKLLEDSTLGPNHQQELLEKISKLA